VPHQGGYLIAGSYFGGPKLPAWATNLRATETAKIRYRGREQTVRWRELEGQERDKSWEVMDVTWPNYAMYAERTDRLIPVFLLTPA
jgi:deazaflavin-dependent oxidoreductase (nitroreductase family)